jgi:hypothetical protein
MDRDYSGDEADNRRLIELFIRNVVFENGTGILWLKIDHKYS